MIKPRRFKALDRLLAFGWVSAIFFVSPLAAQNVIAPDDLVALALANLELVDRGRSGAVWDEASPLFKGKTSREAFVSTIAKSRPSFRGAPPRSWSGVTRAVLAEHNAAGMPAGVYAKILFFPRLVGGKNTSEQLGFWLDADERWRMTGYEYTVLP
jgi:hypothetical protein